jgi:uncharacterized protein YacL (UPF0231 family)
MTTESTGPVTTAEALAKAPRKKHGRITGGQVAAILGVSKTMKRAQVLRSMVREYHGAESEYVENVATEYANQYREAAELKFENHFKRNITRADIKKPHKLLSTHPLTINGKDRTTPGLLYLRLPYGQRDASSPKDFKPMSELPHHFAQMQIEMMNAGLTWGVFAQWSVLALRAEIVELDLRWIEVSMPQLEAFYAEYKEACKDKAHLEPLRKQIKNTLAEKLLAEYDELSVNITNHKARKDEILEQLKKMADEKSVTICGRNLTRIETAGSISYSAAVKKLLPGADLEAYRGSPSTKWTLD